MPIVYFVTQNINLQLGTTVLGLGHALSIQYFLFHFIYVHGGVRYLPCNVKKKIDYVLITIMTSFDILVRSEIYLQ